MEGYQQGAERRGEKVQGINGQYRIDRGWGVKNSIGNGEAKELICTSHGLKLRGEENAGGGARWRGIKWREKWDNYNSIINKIYF